MDEKITDYVNFFLLIDTVHRACLTHHTYSCGCSILFIKSSKLKKNPQAPTPSTENPNPKKQTPGHNPKLPPPHKPP